MKLSFNLKVIILIISFVAAQSIGRAISNPAIEPPPFPATERVRLILEASGLSNKEAYLLLGDAIHEHAPCKIED